MESGIKSARMRAAWRVFHAKTQSFDAKSAKKLFTIPFFFARFAEISSLALREK
jgi:hypothetical protein